SDEADHEALLIQSANFDAAVGDRDGHVLTRNRTHEFLPWSSDDVVFAAAIRGNDGDPRRPAFLKRSLCRNLDAALSVQRLAPRAKALGSLAEVRPGLISTTVCICKPAARLFHGGVPGGRERDYAQCLLA